MMDEELNYYVLFRGDFPWPDDEYFAASDELAELLEQGLQERGLVIEKIDRSELGHYFTLNVGGVSFNIQASADITIDEKGQFSLLHFAKKTYWGKPIPPPHEDYRDLLIAINEVLQESDRVSDIRWYPGFETSDYLSLLPKSTGPIRDPNYEENLPDVIKWDNFLSRISSPSVALPISFLIFLCFLVVTAIVPKLLPVLKAIGLMLFFSVVLFIPLFMGSCIRSAVERQHKKSVSDKKQTNQDS